MDELIEYAAVFRKILNAPPMGVTPSDQYHFVKGFHPALLNPNSQKAPLNSVDKCQFTELQSSFNDRPAIRDSNSFNDEEKPFRFFISERTVLLPQQLSRIPPNIN